MSTSLWYHAFGIRGSKDVRTEYPDGQVIFTIPQEAKTCRCPAGGSPQVQSRGHVERRFRSRPLGSRTTAVVRPIPRLECRAWGVVRPVEVAFADPRRTGTRAFQRYARELSRRMTIRDVARHLNVSGDVIQDIPKRDRSRRVAKVQLTPLRRIAIDAIAVGQGHRDLTIVMDLESGAVVFVGDGKGADALKPSRKRRRPSRATIEAVAIDRSAAYRRAVSTHRKGAGIVFDPVHVIKLFHERRSERRRAVYREATDVMPKDGLPGTRWLRLKDPEDLDPEKDQKKRREEAPAWNKPRATADCLKQDLRRFGEQPGQRLATAFLDGGIRRAEASGVQRLRQRAQTLAAHRGGLRAADDVRITSGPMEGTHHKIKTMKRPAYGFRDPESFKRKILAIHETKYALVG